MGRRRLMPPSRLVQQYRVSEYISFVLLLLLGMTIAFQMPLSQSIRVP
jgi:Sec-independent protein secretion pathway component TatC